ncbi:hypothetical protein D3C87_1705940 [compost metagenome]
MVGITGPKNHQRGRLIDFKNARHSIQILPVITGRQAIVAAAIKDVRHRQGIVLSCSLFPTNSLIKRQVIDGSQSVFHFILYKQLPQS